MKVIHDIPDNIVRQFYEAYADAAGWKSLATGSPLPKWEDLKFEIIEGWRVVASKAYDLFDGQIAEYQRQRLELLRESVDLQRESLTLNYQQAQLWVEALKVKEMKDDPESGK